MITRDSNTRRMAETPLGGSGRSPSSAGRQASPESSRTNHPHPLTAWTIDAIGLIETENMSWLRRAGPIARRLNEESQHDGAPPFGTALSSLRDEAARASSPSGLQSTGARGLLDTDWPCPRCGVIGCIHDDDLPAYAGAFYTEGRI
jgi:hypothetical protein